MKMDISLGGINAAKRSKDRNTASDGRVASTKHKKLVGLKIGSSQLAAARVTNNGSAQLVQVARGALDPGIVVGGELRDPDALSAALKDFFAKNKLPRRGVRLGLANNRIGVRIFELEGIEDSRQLANAIRFRAQDALPIPIDEAVLDYQVLDERVDEDGKTVRRVLLVVAYRELIDRYVGACRKAGIQLVGIDLEAFALLRALSDAQPAESDDAPAAAARRRLDRARPLDVRRLRRPQLRVHARARMGRRDARRRHRAQARPGTVAGRADQAPARARG